MPKKLNIYDVELVCEARKNGTLTASDKREIEKLIQERLDGAVTESGVEIFVDVSYIMRTYKPMIKRTD